MSLSVYVKKKKAKKNIFEFDLASLQMLAEIALSLHEEESNTNSLNIIMNEMPYDLL